VEESTPDMAASLKEGWMKSAYQWLAGQVRPERGIQEQQMSRFYKGMMDKMAGYGRFAKRRMDEIGIPVACRAGQAGTRYSGTADVPLLQGHDG
ncbi:hypothetical protein, partial [Erwinia amylovora]|uniref:hypothetical protein n=1 Tax=Erwinia amylovora TaxID=552 RepID=UPI003D021AD9